VPQFRSKLLIGKITDSLSEILVKPLSPSTTTNNNNNVKQFPTLRSLFQEAVQLMRSCYASTHSQQQQSQGPAAKRQQREIFSMQTQRLERCLDRMVQCAQEADVFSGELSVADFWTSDYRCFDDFLAMF
jgi:hypothetical protein